MSQKLTEKLRISKNDAFTYFLQRNYWPKITFEEFEEICKKQGIIIYEEEKKDETNAS